MMPRAWHRNYQKSYYKKKKEILLNMLGGKCSCGSTKDLQFDHIDSGTKKFSIGKLLNFKWEVVLHEVKKCQLLCRDCHIKKSVANKDLSKNKPRGEKIGSSKLKDFQVIEIRKLSASGMGPRKLAKMFGVSRHTIRAIKLGMIWRHLL